MPIGCLLCEREIQPFPPLMPNARGFERALLCRWHFRESLDPEWFTMGAAAYWERLDKVNQTLSGQTVRALWQTPEIYSLLLVFDVGCLLLYPQNEAALFSFVPQRLLHPGRPSGLLPLQDQALTPRLLQRAFVSLHFLRDAFGAPDERSLTLTMSGGDPLHISATGSRAFGNNPEDVCELVFSHEVSQ
jgi:hypothetical protein